MKYILVVDEKEVIYKIDFSDRKSVAIKITGPYKFEVKAPRGIKVQRVVELVENKKKWISKKSKEMELVNFKPYEKKFEDGELHLVFGEEFRLNIMVIENLKSNRIEYDKGEIYINTDDSSPEYIKFMLEKLYRQLTLNEVMKSVRKIQPLFKEVPTQVKVKEQKRRWGSCTGKDGLLFNWRLSMCPKDVIEYVVLHEMCHMVHKNHSKDYWDLVSSLMPNYKDKELWLKQNAHKVI